jgi:hypothetical protein
VPERPIPPARRQHLEAISGPLGIWQHADGATPDQAFGTCTDDVARALMVDLLHRHTLGWEAVWPSARRSMTYLEDAFDEHAGTFRNFRAADGAWLDASPSQDSQGRAMLALGTTARDAPEVLLRRAASSLLVAALPGVARLTSPRAMASAILGLDAALEAGIGAAEPTYGHLVSRFRSTFVAPEYEVDDEWVWPEAILSYENALLPHALLVAGRRLGDADLRRMGLAVLDWLIAAQTSRGGEFSPIGSDGWWERGGLRSRFDQQPIDATATILAAAAAFDITEDPGYRHAAEAAYAWFLGDNDAHLAVADVEVGACHDGLSEHEVNRNQGAESTLMWLIAVEAMRSLRVRSTRRRARGTQPRAFVVSEVRS